MAKSIDRSVRRRRNVFLKALVCVTFGKETTLNLGKGKKGPGPSERILRGILYNWSTNNKEW